MLLEWCYLLLDHVRFRTSNNSSFFSIFIVQNRLPLLWSETNSSMFFFLLFIRLFHWTPLPTVIRLYWLESVFQSEKEFDAVFFFLNQLKIYIQQPRDILFCRLFFSIWKLHCWFFSQLKIVCCLHLFKKNDKQKVPYTNKCLKCGLF